MGKTTQQQVAGSGICSIRNESGSCAYERRLGNVPGQHTRCRCTCLAGLGDADKLRQNLNESFTHGVVSGVKRDSCPSSSARSWDQVFKTPVAQSDVWGISGLGREMSLIMALGRRQKNSHLLPGHNMRS